MVKNYNLKIELTSPKKIQRLLKTIDTNAKEDRKEARNLLETVKRALTSYLETDETDENGEAIPKTGETFHRLVQSAVLALNQAGIANERLLKLAALLNKSMSDKNKDKDLGKGLMDRSVFTALEELANNDEEDDK